jgi:hypothetical protein
MFVTPSNPWYMYLLIGLPMVPHGPQKNGRVKVNWFGALFKALSAQIFALAVQKRNHWSSMWPQTNWATGLLVIQPNEKTRQ